MLEGEAKEKIESAGGSWDEFIYWMRGQTVGMNKDGSTDFYSHDVLRYIGYGCDAKNEPAGHFD